MGQAPTSQATPRDTAHLRPSNLAARTLSLVEHTLSKFCRDPCPVRRGLVAAMKCCVRKARFFLPSLGREQKYPITTDDTAGGFQYDEGKSCCFLFSDSIFVGLTTVRNEKTSTGYRCPTKAHTRYTLIYTWYPEQKPREEHPLHPAHFLPGPGRSRKGEIGNKDDQTRYCSSTHSPPVHMIYEQTKCSCMPLLPTVLSPVCFTWRRWILEDRALGLYLRL